MSLNCDGVLDDDSPCNGTFNGSDKFCRFCGKRKDKVKKIMEPKPIDPESDTNEHGREPEYTTENIPIEDLEKQNDFCKDSDDITEDPDVDIGSDSVQEESNDTSKTKFQEIESLASGPGRSEIEVLEEIAQLSLPRLQEYINKKNNEWMDTQLHIGVTGLSGVGKSSFINAIRGVKPGHQTYAKVDINETTTEVTSYPHPDNQNLIFWDMPGAGTKSFPREGYFEKVQFYKYDIFLILFHKRFHEDVTWLAKQVKSLGKQCLFIRTHTHVDVQNDRIQNPFNLSTEVTLGRIRQNSLKNLEEYDMKTDEVFLIDNNMPYLYDFDKLTARLIKEISDEKKREAFVLSLSTVSESVINEKKKTLEQRILRIAFTSAMVGTVPLRLARATVDTILITGEADEYRKQFGLTEEALKAKFPGSNIFEEFRDHYLTLATNTVFTITPDEMAEAYVKIGIPVRSLISSKLSFGATIATLRKILNALAEDAHKVNRMMISSLS